MPLESLLGPRVTSAIAYVVAALTLFSLLYGSAKVAWSKITGRAFPTNALTRQLDALAELGSNVIGFVNKLSPRSPLIANPEVLRRDALLAEVRAELAAVTARLPSLPSGAAPADPVAPALPTPVEPSPVLRAATLTGRETIAPAEVSDAHYAAARAVVHAEIGAPTKPSQSGHVEGAAMIGACIVALAASLLCAGCPYVREGALRASTVVSDPRDCVPLASRCVAGVPVICSPSPVPGSVLHREWPLLPRDGTGAQRACSGGCVIDDAGAHCVLTDAAVDGGAL